jgi:hypothetical protein
MAIIVEIKAELIIKGAELLEAMLLSIPIYNQAGTNIIAPPIPNIPPVKPPAKPKIIAFLEKV